MLRSFFIALSSNRPFRRFAERSALGRRVSRRFVAGMTVEEALDAAARLNAEGIDVSLDSLGEGVREVAQAEASAAVYHQLLDRIATLGLRANVSVKLSQMGMEIGPTLAERIVAGIVQHAAQTQNFVRIDMEGSGYTEMTLDIAERLHARFPGAVGTVLQAYLRRTADDTERLLRGRVRIRLCKGAYKEPETLAFPRKADVDDSYMRLMKRLVTSGVFCGIATHDERIVDELRAFVTANDIDKRAFEFQMLYGVRRDLQRSLVRQGYRMRVYVPFGTEWYPYFMRRLAERPANVLFLAKNFFRT